MSVYVCAITTVVLRLTAPAPSYFEEMTRFWRKKIHWSWPGNPNGRSKFRNLGLFTFTRSQLTRRLRRWWRLPEIAQTARNGCQIHRQDDQDRSKFRKYENVCLRDQAKRIEQLFAATNDAVIDDIANCFFFLLSLATDFVFTFEK